MQRELTNVDGTKYMYTYEQLIKEKERSTQLIWSVDMWYPVHHATQQPMVIYGAMYSVFFFTSAAFFFVSEYSLA